MAWCDFASVPFGANQNFSSALAEAIDGLGSFNDNILSNWRAANHVTMNVGM